MLIWIGDIIGCVVAFVVFIVPFLFMFINSLKDRKEANALNMKLPEVFHWENYWKVIKESDFLILRAFKNSLLLSFFAVIILVIICSMGGYYLQRRKDRLSKALNIYIMLGLMIPSAILPTIWVLQRLGIFKTLFSMVLVEVALTIPFTIMLYIGYMSGIPSELEESAYIDGCGPGKTFWLVIFPLLKSIHATSIILNAVSIFNDFTNPLYFLPGQKNVTVQQTIYNFMGRYQTSYNLLFADVILITLPMLILFLIFNKKIVEGIVAGAVKG